jgi:hypothetical protein
MKKTIVHDSVLTAKHLIEELKKIPPDTPVVVMKKKRQAI